MVLINCILLITALSPIGHILSVFSRCPIPVIAGMGFQHITLIKYSDGSGFYINFSFLTPFSSNLMDLYFL